MSNIISPAQVNMTKCNGLALFLGSYWSVPVSVVNRENGVDTPVDLSGYTGTCAIKYRVDDDTPIWTPEVTISEDDHSMFIISLSSDQSLNFSYKAESFADIITLYYEVKLKDSISNEEYRAIYGDLEAVPAVIDNDDNN